MGPVVRYLGPLAPKQTWVWQDIVPAGKTPSADQVAKAKAAIDDSGLTVSQLVSTAWKSASSYRNSDMRGGANGGRIRLQPQLGWEANEPDELAQVIRALEGIAADSGLSFADTVVLAGNVGVEKAAKAAGFDIQVPFTGGRGDATQEQTDLESFSYLEPKADGFRNYAGKGLSIPSEYQLIDRANQLNLTGPETVVLLGGLRVLDTNHGGSKLGVLTDTPSALTTDYFVNLTDMAIKWAPTAEDGVYVGNDRKTGAEVHRQPGRPAARVECAVALVGRGLRRGRRQGEVRQGLRRGVGQGDGRRPVRREEVARPNNRVTKPREPYRSRGFVHSASPPLLRGGQTLDAIPTLAYGTPPAASRRTVSA
jgi:catalase-peroxidase